MDVSVGDAKTRLSALIRAMKDGETIVITRNGKPVMQLTPPPRQRRRIILGGMRDRVKFLPVWDEPITDSDLLSE